MAAGRNQPFVSRPLPVVPPIYQSAIDAAAEAIRRLEDAPAAVMTSSGMAAIATTILALCPDGGRVVAAREVYGNTRDLFVRDLPGLGIDVTLVSVADLDGWERALAEAPARVCYVEGMSNPQLRLADIPAIAELARAAGAALVVDNTFASPYSLNPFTHGADIVLHSATKYLSGHPDVLAGVVLSDEQTVEQVQRRVVTFGGCLDPHAAYLVWRGLQTFHLRLARQNATAAVLAGFLQAREDVLDVRYPGLASHPQHDLAWRIM
jgi:cystathionine beta-lyase/cystathionine gamma-synthase